MIFLFILFMGLFGFTEEAGISLLYFQPYADVFGTANLTLVSGQERVRGALNSAFLGNISKNVVSFSFSRDYYERGYYSYLSFSTKIKNFGVNFSYDGYRSQSEEFYINDELKTSIDFEKDDIFRTSFGINLKDIYFGFKLKFLSSTLAEKYKANTFAFDGDLIFNMIDNFKLYFGIENLGGSLKYFKEKENLPIFYKMELSKDFTSKTFFLRTGMGLKISDDYSTYMAGVSFGIKKFPIEICSGYSYVDDYSSFFTVGTSISLEDFYLSYAIEFPKVFNSNMQKITISYFFDFSFLDKDYKKDKIQKNKKKDENKTPNKLPSIIIF